jgi:aminoglycoside 2'-N-acetyltransferase I
MVEVLIAEPGELNEAQLDAAETLVRTAFGSGFRSHDWLHAVTGVHVALTER